MSDRAEFEQWYTNNFGRRATEFGYETDICWKAWQAARSNGTTVPMTRIAEKKLAQLGGDVCGVLVWDGSGVMAVSEHGRCTRLDAGVMGPVAPSVMSERALFEQKFPAPQGVEWIDDNQGYRITSDDDYWWESEGQAHFRGYLGQWIGWQAGRAQSGQCAEIVSDEAFEDEFQGWWQNHGQFVRSGGGNYERTFAFEAWRYLYPKTIYTQPQPAVPEGWKLVPIESTSEMDLAAEDADLDKPVDRDHAEAIWNIMIATAPEAPTTPQADAWISMKDQFPRTFEPKLGWNKTANVRHEANTYRIFSPIAENVCDISHWMDLPQPPKQEGEGDE